MGRDPVPLSHPFGALTSPLDPFPQAFPSRRVSPIGILT
jgi:hypothetical protein